MGQIPGKQDPPLTTAQAFWSYLNPVNVAGDQISMRTQAIPGPQIPLPTTDQAVAQFKQRGDTAGAASLYGVTPKRKGK